MPDLSPPDRRSDPGRLDDAPPNPAPRWRPRGQDELAPSGERARARANLDALGVLRELQRDARHATDAEQRVLARWSGWGAVPSIFDARQTRWAPERAELEALIGAERMTAASRSTLNAHYTDIALVQQVWRAVQNLGFEGGRVLEPGCGVGAFVATAPPDTTMTAVEVEPATAGIAQALNPTATVLSESFADTRRPPGHFDLTIGNVPFGKVALHDRTHNAGGHSIHNHFIIKSLDLTRPGGVVAVLTSRWTLDAANPAARREIAEQADLLGAVRLPNGAHERAAGTDVVTDLLVLRRRSPEAVPTGPAWQRTTIVDTPSGQVALNEYYAARPDAVLGELGLGHGAYGAETLRVERRDGSSVAEQLGEALERVVDTARTHDLLIAPRPQDDAHDAAHDAAPALSPQRSEQREGLLQQADDGSFTEVVDGRPTAYRVPATQTRELSALIGLRDTYVRLLDLEAAHRTDTPAIDEARAELNTRYDAYLDRFGPINRFTLRSTGRIDPQTTEMKTARQRPGQGGFRSDPYASAVAGLEDFDAATQTASKTDVFRGRVIAPRAARLGADSPADAIAICLDTHGRLQLDELAALLGTGQEDAREQVRGLAFHDPTEDRLVPAAEYLSGNVRTKLDAARVAAESDPELVENVAALVRVQPEDLTPEQIAARLGAAWIDAKYVEAFMNEVLEDPAASVEHAGGSTWGVEGRKWGVAATDTWGTSRRPAPDLVHALLEQRTIKVFDEIERDGRTTRLLNMPETVSAQEKAAAIAARFADWIWEDPARAEDLASTYNRKFNAVVLRSYDGAELTLPGLVQSFTPRPHQYAAVARMIHEPAVGLFHEVGAGKTAEMAMGAMELRRLGLVRKPAIVVPNNMLEQFGREFAQLYPQAKLLVASTDDLAGSKRRAFVGRVTSGDWDAVIMTRSAFERMPLSPDNQAEYLDRESSRMRARLERIKNDSESRGLTVKRLERAVQSFEERTKKAIENGRRDPGITFEHSGIDYVIVDEAHAYKNLATPSAIDGAAIAGSQRATDLDMKLDWLRHSQGDRIVTLATATPIANSITETYVMQRYTRPDLLESAGIEDFDQWAATFGERVSAVEMTPDAGGFRIKERFSRFVNVPELLTLWHVSADIKTAADLKLPTPDLAERADGQRVPETVLLEPPDALRDYVSSLGQRADDVRSRRVEPDVDNMLKISSDGRAAALDLRLLDPTNTPGPKVTAAADRIAERWQRHRGDQFDRGDGTPHPTAGALQIVFCDLGTPSERWNVYDALRAELVARGMPREQVRFMHEATTDAAKGALFAAARSGEVAVLMGSTERMGVGTNVQRRAVALHHLDCPWRPADLHQRDGRIMRQGNQYGQIEILRYVVEGSFDGYSWQTVERKSRFIDQVMHGRLDVREIEDVGEGTLSFDEVKALASGDPRVLEKAQVDADVARLERLDRSHSQSQTRMARVVEDRSTGIAQASAAIERIDQALALRVPTRGDAFAAELDGARFTERAPFAEALSARLARPSAAASGTVEEIGRLGGLTLTLAYERRLVSGSREAVLDWREAPGKPVTLTLDVLQPRPLGAVSSLESRLDGLDQRRHQLVASIEEGRTEIERAQAQLGQPFARADELATARNRAEHLRQEMTDLASRQEGEQSGVEGEPGPEPHTDGEQPIRATVADAPAPSPEPPNSGDRPHQAEPSASASTLGVDTPPPFQPSDVRRALIDQVVADHGAEYGRPGAPAGGGPANAARYLIEGHLPDASREEWTWLEKHLRARPDLLTGPVPTQEDLRHRAGERRGRADELSRDARAQFDVGRVERARDLIDQAALADPTRTERWERIRAIIGDASPTSSDQENPKRQAERATPRDRGAEAEQEHRGIGSAGVERARAAIARTNTTRAASELADFERREAAGHGPTHDLQQEHERT